MIRRELVAGTLAVVLTGPPPAVRAAEEGANAQRGDRIRITAAAVQGDIRGTILREDDQSITFVPSDGALPMTMPRRGGDRKLVGTLVRMGEDSVTVLLDGHREPSRIPQAAVKDLRVSLGKKRNTIEGLLVGTLLSFAVLASKGPERCETHPDRGLEDENALCPLGPALHNAAKKDLAITAVVLGATIGALTKRERWQRASERPSPSLSLAPAAGPGVGLTLGVSF